MMTFEGNVKTFFVRMILIYLIAWKVVSSKRVSTIDTKSSNSSFSTGMTKLPSKSTSKTTTTTTTEPAVTRQEHEFEEEVRIDSTCPDGLPFNGYNGIVEITNGGRRCQKWMDQIPHSHNYNSSHFPRDSSMERAENYCRPVGDDPLPWCYTNDHYVRRQYCYGHICGMDNAICGGTVSGSSGKLTYISNDFHKYGFDDELRDCAWKIISSKSNAIQLDVHAIAGPSTTCDKTYLEIYEASIFYGRFCSNDSMPFIEQSVSTILNVRFVTEVYKTQFNATYYQVVPMKGTSVLSPVCDDIILVSYAEGLLMPPDRNYDRMYDVMDDCTWVLQAPVDKRIRAEVLFMDIQFHPECLFDFLQIYEGAKINGRYCGNEKPTIISWSQVLNVRFHSDFEITGMGFYLSYNHVMRDAVTFPIRPPAVSRVIVPVVTTDDNDERIYDKDPPNNGSLSSKDTTKSAGMTTDGSHFTTKSRSDRTSSTTKTTVFYESTEFSDSSAGTIGTTSWPILGRTSPRRHNMPAVYNGQERAKHTAYIYILFIVVLKLGKLQEN